MDELLDEAFVDDVRADVQGRTSAWEKERQTLNDALSHSSESDGDSQIDPIDQYQIALWFYAGGIAVLFIEFLFPGFVPISGLGTLLIGFGTFFTASGTLSENSTDEDQHSTLSPDYDAEEIASYLEDHKAAFSGTDTQDDDEDEREPDYA